MVAVFCALPLHLAILTHWKKEARRKEIEDKCTLCAHTHKHTDTHKHKCEREKSCRWKTNE